MTQVADAPAPAPSVQWDADPNAAAAQPVPSAPQVKWDVAPTDLPPHLQPTPTVSVQPDPAQVKWDVASSELPAHLQTTPQTSGGRLLSNAINMDDRALMPSPADPNADQNYQMRLQQRKTLTEMIAQAGGADAAAKNPSLTTIAFNLLTGGQQQREAINQAQQGRTQQAGAGGAFVNNAGAAGAQMATPFVRQFLQGISQDNPYAQHAAAIMDLAAQQNALEGAAHPTAGMAGMATGIAADMLGGPGKLLGSAVSNVTDPLIGAGLRKLGTTIGVPLSGEAQTSALRAMFGGEPATKILTQNLPDNALRGAANFGLIQAAPYLLSGDVDKALAEFKEGAKMGILFHSVSQTAESGAHGEEGPNEEPAAGETRPPPSATPPASNEVAQGGPSASPEGQTPLKTPPSESAPSEFGGYPEEHPSSPIENIPTQSNYTAEGLRGEIEARRAEREALAAQADKTEAVKQEALKDAEPTPPESAQGKLPNETDLATGEVPHGTEKGAVPGPWRDSARGDEAQAVPLEQLDALPRNGIKANASKVGDQADSMEVHGQKEPVVIKYDAETGRASIDEGNHRIAAAKELGWDQAAARVEVVNGEPGQKMSPSEVFDAVREQGPGAVLQREPGEAGGAGGQRGGVEQGQQGAQPARPGDQGAVRGRAAEKGEPAQHQEPAKLDEGVSSNFTHASLRSMKYADVREIAKKMGVDARGTREILTGRIMAKQGEKSLGDLAAKLPSMKWHELESLLKTMEKEGPTSSAFGRDTSAGSERYQMVREELDRKLAAQQEHAEKIGIGEAVGPEKGPKGPERAPGFKTAADKKAIVEGADPAEVARLSERRQETRPDAVYKIKPGGATKASASAILKFKDFIRGEPEFHADPTFTVEGNAKEGTWLRWKDGATYKFAPEKLGFSSEGLTEGMKLRVNPEEILRAKKGDAMTVAESGDGFTPEATKGGEFSNTKEALKKMGDFLGGKGKKKGTTLGSGLGGASDFFEHATDLAVALIKDLAIAGKHGFEHFVKAVSDQVSNPRVRAFMLRGENGEGGARALYNAARTHPDITAHGLENTMTPEGELPTKQSDINALAKMTPEKIAARAAERAAARAAPPLPPTEAQTLREATIPPPETLKGTIRRTTGMTDQAPLISTAEALRIKLAALEKATNKGPAEETVAKNKLYDVIGGVKREAQAPKLASEINRDLITKPIDPFEGGRIDPKKQMPQARDAMADLIGNLRQPAGSAEGAGKLADFIQKERDLGHSNDAGMSEEDLKTLRGLDGKKLAEMKPEETALLTQAIQHAAFLGEQYNEANAHSRLAEVKSQRDDMIEGMRAYHPEPIAGGQRGELAVNPRRNPVVNFLGNALRDPFRFLKLNLGAGGEAMWRRLADGQTKAFEAINQAKDTVESARKGLGITDENWRAMSQEAREIQLSHRRLSLSPREIISFINGWGRESTQRDMQRAGIIPKRLQGEARETTQISPEDARTIIAAATPAEREIARVMQEHLVKSQLHADANAASVREAGYEKLTEPNYWPRSRDFEQSPRAVVENMQQQRDAMLKDLGFLKEAPGTPHAPVLIEDAGDVFTRHVAQVARFAHLNDATRDLAMIQNDPAFGAEARSRLGRQFGKQLTDTMQRLTGMEDHVEIPGAKLLANIRGRIATGELTFRLTSALNHFMGGALAVNKIPEGEQAAFLKNFALKAVPDMALIRDMESRNAYLRNRGTQSGRNLESPVDVETPPKTAFGRALDKAGDVGTAHIRLSDRMDSAAIYKTFIDKYKAEHPGATPTDAKNWAAKQTEYTVRQTSTASTPFENSYFAQRVGRIPGLNLLTLFQSKTSAMRNTLDEAYQDWRVDPSGANVRKLATAGASVAAMIAAYAGVGVASNQVRRGFASRSHAQEKQADVSEATQLAAHVADVMAPGIGGTAVRDVKAAVTGDSQSADIVTQTSMKAVTDLVAAVKEGKKGHVAAAMAKVADLLNGAGKFFGVSAEQPTQYLEGAVKAAGGLRSR